MMMDCFILLLAVGSLFWYKIVVPILRKKEGQKNDKYNIGRF